MVKKPMYLLPLVPFYVGTEAPFSSGKNCKGLKSSKEDNTSEKQRSGLEGVTLA
jgi:hypothetical protein